MANPPVAAAVSRCSSAPLRRRLGGGRGRAPDVYPGLRPALLALVESDERGDPILPPAD
ncbi:hypothetical protein GQF42_16165 [Streptomyces broussonetiae]|uniref:Uncharacterized protein n=1 Tax=Streptomyces broussonetiae TaxID=2686304 RepID=A0A6I6MW80_9ACTN|nr:hypothetical protein GQF42_16165 [Streptomyces broussonetiae]